MKPATLICVFTVALLLLFSGCFWVPADQKPLAPPVSNEYVVDYGDITSPQTWDQTDLPYVVIGPITIKAAVTWARNITVVVDRAKIDIEDGGSLTIGEGVTIKMTANTYFQVGYSGTGTLIALGSASLPIIFTNRYTDQTWGTWGFSGDSSGDGTGAYGLFLGRYLTPNSSLRNCIIEHATGGIFVDNATVAISYCTIRANRYRGITFNGSAAPDTIAPFDGNQLVGNGDFPLMISAEQLRTLTGSGSFTGNAAGKDAIYVVGTDSNVRTSGTWHRHNVPYVFSTPVNIESTNCTIVTIEPGTRLRFLTGAYLQIGHLLPATLIANGTASSPITFTSYATAAGAYWGYDNGGLNVGPFATANTSITNSVIEYSTYGILLAADITVSNCSFLNNEYYGIVYSSASVRTQTGNTFGGNGSGDTLTLP
jgi:hypothetical protein